MCIFTCVLWDRESHCFPQTSKSSLRATLIHYVSSIFLLWGLHQNLIQPGSSILLKIYSLITSNRQVGKSCQELFVFLFNVHYKNIENREFIMFQVSQKERSHENAFMRPFANCFQKHCSNFSFSQEQYRPHQ